MAARKILPGRFLLEIDRIAGMSRKQREFTPDQLAEAQRLYEQTATSMKAVADYLGISTTTLKNRLAFWGWTPRSTQMPKKAASKKSDGIKAQALKKKPPHPTAVADNHRPPVVDSSRPASWQGQPCTGLVACPERTALIARLWASVSRQIARIDAAHAAFVADGRANAAEAEGHVKLIAALARTMRELAALDASLQDKSQEERAAHDSLAPRNADAFRDELAKRLAALETGVEKKIAGVTDAG